MVTLASVWFKGLAVTERLVFITTPPTPSLDKGGGREGDLDKERGSLEIAFLSSFESEVVGGVDKLKPTLTFFCPPDSKVKLLGLHFFLA
jgi:hypothetical protein